MPEAISKHRKCIIWCLWNHFSFSLWPCKLSGSQHTDCRWNAWKAKEMKWIRLSYGTEILFTWEWLLNVSTFSWDLSLASLACSFTSWNFSANWKYKKRCQEAVVISGKARFIFKHYLRMVRIRDTLKYISDRSSSLPILTDNKAALFHTLILPQILLLLLLLLIIIMMIIIHQQLQ